LAFTPKEKLMKNRIYQSVILLTIMICLLSCGADVDRAILLNNSCTFPCWREIAPGETTRTQAMRILESQDDVRKITTLKSFFPTSSLPEWVMWEFSNGSSAHLYLDGNDIVQGMVINFNYLTYTDLISILGEPNNVRIFYVSYERPYIVTYVYFELYNIISENVSYSINSAGNPIIQDNSRVHTIYIYSDVYEKEIMNEDYNVLFHGEIDMSNYSPQPWKGFGDYLFNDR
jgi:hypothetical protein